jgi:hypothetical protein
LRFGYRPSAGLIHPLGTSSTGFNSLAFKLSCLTLAMRQHKTLQRPPLRTENRKPAWRRACLTYREMCRLGASDREAYWAAAAAVRAVWPMPWKEAKAEATHAVAYAIRHHPEWFWQGREKLWERGD